MRRLPIYFLVDVSESMVGGPIEEVQQGMRTIVQQLRTDPYALETVYLSIIAFAGKAVTLSPLTEIYQFYPPAFPIGGGTSLGAGMNALMDDIDRNVKKTTIQERGDWKPLIFLFTDGNPTDNYIPAFNRWNSRYRGHCNLVAISIGDNVNVLTLSQITNDILLLKETDAESFAKFFKWISASIQTTSMAVETDASDNVKLAPTTGINLEKVEVRPEAQQGYSRQQSEQGYGSQEAQHGHGGQQSEQGYGGSRSEQGYGRPEATYVDVDDNFAVLHGRCSSTGRDYLVKFARRRPSAKGYGYSSDGRYSLVGAYPVDKDTYRSLSAGAAPKINTTMLRGMPACPCCGNQLGIVICDCGGIFCVGDDTTVSCPWCGMQGELGEISAGGLNVNRGLG